MSYYSPNPHYAPDDLSEDCERLERAEAEAGWYFNSATKPQQARFSDRMSAAFAYRGSPRWEREREAAQKEFTETTVAASALCAETVRELMETGEVSEALSYRWDELAVTGAMAQAAE
ncbi:MULTISPECIES: hypothetical protein [unclassified Bradyrhizobium]|uniref:hypothetical protein n=1 Tax=unclassified Bradyrhizobium TaxID=2631580 RepID=UPI001BA8942A|nr:MULTISPECIES: hypothetical protein [unclassified Bradyrhizobium]MBR1206588.1 hypothetical protein [Bradyrhizobium sp. AUGA SZCCT0124]MBR1315434.1 hypothetical protein [Bradyrhizobium sp. AUGA SZCCT0051]MBR1338504.1 hypothetical protein [Bradyrhizobium sp. AUGA SZCCT0105]MBR1356159.1 hypothetical protein [Bradyrhizobium sp. AUGA SZCCT0045]